MYMFKAKKDAPGKVIGGEIVAWSTGEIREIADADINYYREHTSVFEEITGPSVVTTGVVGTYGSAFIDFNTAAGEPAMSVTINGVVYLEADTAVPATGVWTNGASCADSATSLIAAINGDTRATVPFTAVADTSGDGLWLFWDAVGVAGNVTITTTSASNCTIQSSTSGSDMTPHDVIHIVHVANTQELLGGAIEIPIPFTPTGFHVSATDNTGLAIAFTDLVTIATTPDRIKITTTGGTNLANTNEIYVTAFN